MLRKILPSVGNSDFAFALMHLLSSLMLLVLIAFHLLKVFSVSNCNELYFLISHKCVRYSSPNSYVQFPKG